MHAFIKTHARTMAVMLLLALATCGVYGGILGQQFLTDWDDPAYVTANEAIRGFSALNIRAAFTTAYVGNYAPVQILSYMLDYTLWGLSPFGFKLSNMVFHGLNGILFYLLLVRITKAPIPSILSAMIFMCHPVQVETVAWISQRKNLLAMLFFLIAFHLYLSYRANGKIWPWYVGTHLTFLLALLAKSVTIIFPLALILYDICFCREISIKRRLLEKLPLLAMAATFAVVSFFFQLPENSGGITEYHGGSPFTTFLTMTVVLLRYLKLLFWPQGLSSGYHIPVVSQFSPQALAAMIVVIMLGVAGLVLFRRRRGLFFWYSLFFLGLLPVSQIVPLVTLMNDRYLYFPLLGAATFVVLATTETTRILPRYRHFMVATVSVVIIALAVAANQRIHVWQDSVTLWKDTTIKMPKASVAWTNLGSASLEAGDVKTAMDSYRKALLLDPANETALTNLGILYANMGDLATAEWYLSAALKIDPGLMPALENLSAVHLMQGRIDLAEGLSRRGIESDDCSHGLWLVLGNIALLKSDVNEALRCYGVAMNHPADVNDRALVNALMKGLYGDMAAAAKSLQSSMLSQRQQRPGEPYYLRTLSILPLHRNISSYLP